MSQATHSRLGTDRLAVLLATCGGVGFSPIAPGTLGAALGVPLACVIAAYLQPVTQWIVIIALFLVGIPICDRAARTLGKEDPGEVIWDEFVTVPVAFLFIPMSQLQTPWIMLAGFGLHRLFDIKKIPPARQLERLHGGVGIMLDDLAAGAWSCVCLHGLIYFLG